MVVDNKKTYIFRKKDADKLKPIDQYLPLPIFCDVCQKWYDGPTFAFPEVVEISLEGMLVGCPDCGKDNSIDGKYEISEKFITIIESSSATKDELQRLFWILLDAYLKKSDVNKLTEKLNVEIPKLTPLSDELQAQSNKSDPAKWIAIVISLLALLLPYIKPPAPYKEPESVTGKAGGNIQTKVSDKTLCYCGNRKAKKVCKCFIDKNSKIGRARLRDTKRK